MDRAKSAVDKGVLIDITHVPLERLADLHSPVLSKVIAELAVRAERPDNPFDFSSAA